MFVEAVGEAGGGIGEVAAADGAGAELGHGVHVDAEVGDGEGTPTDAVPVGGVGEGLLVGAVEGAGGGELGGSWFPGA